LFEADRVDHAHAALAVLLSFNGLRVSEACSADIENLGFERGHRTLRSAGKGTKLAVIPLVPTTATTIDLAIGERRPVRYCFAATAAASTGAPPTAGCDRSTIGSASAWRTRTC
jgi:integrase